MKKATMTVETVIRAMKACRYTKLNIVELEPGVVMDNTNAIL